MKIIELRVGEGREILCYAAHNDELAGKSVGDKISIFDENTYSSKTATIVKLS